MESPMILRDGVYYSKTHDGIIFSVETDTEAFTPTYRPIAIAGSGAQKTYEYMAWGNNDNMPDGIERLILSNDKVGALMETKRDLLCGFGLMAYEESLIDDPVTQETRRHIKEVPMPQQAIDLYEASGELELFTDMFGELIKHSNCFIETIKGLGEDRIAQISVKKCRNIRATKKDSGGIIPNWLWANYWGNMPRNGETTQTVYEVPNFRTEWGKDLALMPNKFIKQISCSILTDDYYFIPVWLGSKVWIELANIIPIFHKYNLENGYTIRWHIEMPKDYFTDKTLNMVVNSATDALEYRKAEDAKRQKFMDKINKFLSGVKNTGRAIFTEYEINQVLGKDYPGIKITPLDVDLKDEALLKLQVVADTVVTSSQGIHPTLANIDSGGTRAGGTEILRAYQLFQMAKTYVLRDTVLRYWTWVNQVNGVPKNIKWMFRDQVLTELSQNKQGTQPAQNA